MAQIVKNSPAMWQTCVQSLGGEDLLEEGMATHSSILAWGIPMDRGACRASKELDMTKATQQAYMHKQRLFNHIISVCMETYNGRASLVAQMVKNLPAVQGTQI